MSDPVTSPDASSFSMWSAIGSILLGAIGWLVTSFFGKPLIDFYNLRREVHEEIVYTGNIGLMDLQNEARRVKFEEAVESIRRLGARVQALNVDAKWPLRTFLDKRGYNTRQAGGALIGLSNSLHTRDGSRALQTHAVQKGLKLPTDHTDEMIVDIRNRMARGERDS